MARALIGSQLIRDIQTRSRTHRSACDLQINLPIYTFKLFKTTRRRNETELNSYLLARCFRTHPKRAQAQRRVSDSAAYWFDSSFMYLCVKKIHIHVGLRLRRNTGNTSVLNHEGEPMDITINVQTLRNSYAGEPLNFSHTESESKKTDGVERYAALTAHILSETRDKSTSTCADNSINE